jgi:8-oxo-dGTP pyrophosphatase MutT (NUDIX family)
MYCKNCGKKGHISRNCNEPITSYGVLLLTNIETIPKIVMIQRKDSLCYIEIIRGKYDIYNTEKLKLLLDRISKDELNNIKNLDFDTLWKRLWLIDDIKETKYMKEYNNSKKLYELFKSDIEINDYLKNKTSEYEMTEWEFPKGKKNINEEKYECAKRELEEETNIKSIDYEIIQNIKPIIENFICKNIENIRINIDNINQKNEIQNVNIVTKDKAIKLLRKYNITKYEILNYVFNFIKKYKNDFVLKY